MVMKYAGVALLAVSLAVAGLGGCAADKAGNPPVAQNNINADALYVRLGGEAGVRAFVDALLTKVTQDERISGRFKGTNAPALKARLVAFLGQATGGPQLYAGKDMKTAHKGLNLTEAEWKAFLEDAKAAMNAQKVPALEQEELLVKLVPMKGDVIGH